ncbi:MAG: hypothetical protein ACMXX8_03605 [Candidatus Woesearchaeota archaeon]
MNKKKSYFLSIDAFIAVSIIIIGFIIMSSQYSFQAYDTQHEIYSKTFLDILSYTVPEYNPQDFKLIDEYVKKDYFHDYSYSLIEHIARFFIINGTNCENCFERAQNLTRNITKILLPEGYSIEIIISNQTHEKSLFKKNIIEMEESKIISTSNKMVAIVEDDIYHPINLRVNLWT